VTALLFLVVDWGVVLTVSFQSPFVIVAFLIGVSHSRIFEVHGWSKWLADSLVVTASVSMETFPPILLNIFGRVSMGVFWLNLIPRSHDGDLNSRYLLSRTGLDQFLALAITRDAWGKIHFW
jgi:hypothetical protein